MPHLHRLITDGGFRPDGTFVSWPAHDTARLTEAFRRAVLRLFVRGELFDEDQAAGMLTWPHSAFHVHTAVWISEDDRAATTVTYRSDKSEDRTAGTATADAPVPMVVAPTPVPTEATRRWAALLRQIFEVDPLVCPTCRGTMRILAFITQASVIDQILMHLRSHAAAGAQPGGRRASPYFHNPD